MLFIIIKFELKQLQIMLSVNKLRFLIQILTCDIFIGHENTSGLPLKANIINKSICIFQRQLCMKKK